MRLKPSKSKWLSYDTWVCQNHYPAVRLTAAACNCYMLGCGSERPLDAAPEKPAEPDPVLVFVKPVAAGPCCTWDSCTETARPNSKYCSRKCSNKNARRRHRARKATQPRVA